MEFLGVRFTDWIALATAMGGVAVAWFAATKYPEDVQNRRAELLYRLFEAFYASDRYRPIRRALDAPDSSKAQQLRSDVITQADTDLHEDFVDYLNFLEFICNLADLGRVANKDVARLFDYYLHLLSRHDWALNYISSEGFEALAKSLSARRSAQWPSHAS